LHAKVARGNPTSLSNRNADRHQLKIEGLP
jgi:hypothetical protein